MSRGRQNHNMRADAEHAELRDDVAASAQPITAAGLSAVSLRPIRIGAILQSNLVGPQIFLPTRIYFIL